jgi:ribosome-associated protein
VSVALSRSGEILGKFTVLEGRSIFIRGIDNKRMNTEALLQLVLLALDDGKGRDIKTIDVRGKTNIADFMVIASGTSERHVKSLAGHVVEEAKKNEAPPIGVEGENVGEWVLVDLGDVIVHVMKPQTREFYQLEKFWYGDYSTGYAAAGMAH